MKKSLLAAVFCLLLFCLFFNFKVIIPGYAQENNISPAPVVEIPPAPQPNPELYESPIPGFPNSVDKTGTEFTTEEPPLIIKSSKQLHLIMDVMSSSSEIVMVDMNIEDLEGTAELTLEGLGKTDISNTNGTNIIGIYYLYTDSYENKQEIEVTNGIAKISVTGSPRHVWIQNKPSTKYIEDNSTGRDCASIGLWDLVSKTCTLNQDLTETIQINSPNIILDCDGHKITGPKTGNGIYINGTNINNKNNVTVKNCKIKDFSDGIRLSYSGYDNLINNTIESNINSGIYIYRGNGNNISDNNIKSNGVWGIYITGISSNTDNKIYHNNFIDNTNKPQIYNYGGYANYFDNGNPSGGNYWSDYSGVDINQNHIGDSPYYLSGGQDNFPFMEPFGWLGADSDGDSFCRSGWTDPGCTGSDNCPFAANSNQANSDNDSFGNVCDNCPDITNQNQADIDNDGIGDVCDNCPNKPNPDQADTDNDGVGNVCDNCPNNANPNQDDSDNDGIADACENMAAVLVNPTTPITVIQGQPFTFSSRVDCVKGNCGDVVATLRQTESRIKMLIYNPNSVGPDDSLCRGTYGKIPYDYLTANGVDYTYWCNSNVINAAVLDNYNVLYVGRSRSNGYIKSADFRSWVQNGGGAILESNGDNYEPGTATYVWSNIYDVFGYNNCPNINMGDSGYTGLLSKYQEHPIWEGTSGVVGKTGTGLYDIELGDSCISTGTKIGTASNATQNPMVNQFGLGKTYSGGSTDYTINENSKRFFLNIIRWIWQPRNPVSTTPGDKPFYTTSLNPQTKTNLACLGNIQTGGSCEQIWSVIPTGKQGKTYPFFTQYLSTSAGDAFTPTIHITIYCDDPDIDGICADADNCPNAYNPNQEDTNNDGIGDACGDCPSGTLEFCDRKDNDCDGLIDENDQTPPATVSNAPSGWQKEDVHVTLTAIDTEGCGVQATYFCVDQTNTCVPNTQGTTVTVVAEGINYLRYLSLDQSGFGNGGTYSSYGNIESVKSDIVKLDKTAPVSTDDYLFDGVWTNVDTNIILTATDTGSGLGTTVTYYCVNQDNTCNPYIGQLYDAPVGITEEGIKWLRYGSVDPAGNYEIPKSIEIKLDKTAPTANIIVDNANDSQCSFFFQWWIDDGQISYDVVHGCAKVSAVINSSIAGIKQYSLKITDSSGSVVKSSVNAPLFFNFETNEAVYSIVVEAYDNAGNYVTSQRTVYEDDDNDVALLQAAGGAPDLFDSCPAQIPTIDTNKDGCQDVLGTNINSISWCIDTYTGRNSTSLYPIASLTQIGNPLNRRNKEWYPMTSIMNAATEAKYTMNIIDRQGPNRNMIFCTIDAENITLSNGTTLTYTKWDNARLVYVEIKGAMRVKESYHTHELSDGSKIYATLKYNESRDSSDLHLVYNNYQKSYSCTKQEEQTKFTCLKNCQRNISCQKECIKDEIPQLKKCIEDNHYQIKQNYAGYKTLSLYDILKLVQYE